MLITPEEKLREKDAALAAKIARSLPDFTMSCREKVDAVIIHQESFAADYQEDEYALLGMAIKFAGLHGKAGKLREKLSTNLPFVFCPACLCLLPSAVLPLSCRQAAAVFQCH